MLSFVDGVVWAKSGCLKPLVRLPGANENCMSVGDLLKRLTGDFYQNDSVAGVAS